MRTLFFGQREGRISTEEVGRVPTLGPHHMEEREVVGRREI
jgi:hypothetical protein